MAEKDQQVVGKRLPRVDAWEKVTGQALFSSDLQLPGMLYGAILHSPHAHARVKSLRAEEARQMPGVHAVVLPEDAPQVSYSSAGTMPSPLVIEDEQVFTEHARYIGDWLAAVAAESRAQAEAAVRAIEVEYELLEPIFDLERAAEPQAPPIHAGGNLFFQMPVEVGDLAAGLQQAERRLSGVYSTQNQQHTPLETTTCVCYWEANRILHVYSTTQVPFHDRRILARIFQIPIAQVRAEKIYTGGGFGSRQHLHQQPVAALLARKTGRPVKMSYNREQDIVMSTTRHPMRHELTSGLSAENAVVAFQNDAYADTGAYSAHGPIILRASASKMPYNFPNFTYNGSCYYTNNPVAGAYRGYGNAQFSFAREVHMEELAAYCAEDPIQFRLRHCLQPGDLNPVGRKKGWLLESSGIAACAEEAMAATNWPEKYAFRNPARATVKKGIGVAFVTHGTGASFNDFSSATVVVNEDGSAQVLAGTVECGQGSDTVISQICAEELGIGFDEVTIVSADTAAAPLDMGSYASRSSFMMGNAVRRAAIVCKQQLLSHAAAMFGLPEEQVRREGRHYLAAGQEPLALCRVAHDAYYGAVRKSIVGHAAYMMENSPPVVGLQIAEIEVDMKTGLIRCPRITAAYDVGRAINPALVEGQIEGGVVQGVGFALLEKLVLDRELANWSNGNLLEYKIPTMLEAPAITSIIVEQAAASGPFGAKSIGEASLLGAAPAIANAVYQATGVFLRHLPLTPDYVLAQFKQAGL